MYVLLTRASIILTLMLLPLQVLGGDFAIYPTGFLECFRLDREPFDEELDVRCEGPTIGPPKIGTFHRDPTKELKTDLVPTEMRAEHAAKLPISTCLWTGVNAAGAGDQLAPVWEAVIDIDWDYGGSSNNLFWESLSSCRWDPARPRVALTDPAIQGRGCINSTGIYEFTNPVSRGQFKSTCDIDIEFFEFELRTRAPVTSSYGECGAYQQSSVRVPEYRYPAGDCATAETIGRNAVIHHKFAAGSDGQYSIGAPGSISKTLKPGIRSVVDTRSIARPLSLENGPATWQTPVVVDGEPGQQHWHENFTELVRVERVRVFSVENKTVNDRQYVSLEGATLTIEDADAAPGATDQCEGEASGFDLVSCQVLVTPTYRITNLPRSEITFLSNPLTWQIVADSIVENGREYYIEFDLVAANRQTTAALMAEVPFVDLGGVAVGDYRHRTIRFTNVGNSHFVIDGVSILPQPGHSPAYLAQRIGDPISVPHPIFAETADQAGVYEIGIENRAYDNPIYGVVEGEDGLSLSMLGEDGMEAELLGEPVVFAGTTVVAQSAYPTFVGQSAAPHRRHPYKFPVYRHWSLPYILAPGRSRTVQVLARPQQQGVQEDRLIVSGYAYNNPSDYQEVNLGLHVLGLTGPQVDHLPFSLLFPHGSRAASTLSVNIVNYGDMDLTRGDVSIVDSGDGLHAGEAQLFRIESNVSSSQVLAPGGLESISVTYDPGCFYQLPMGGTHIAVLRIDTDAGVREIPLRGDPVRWSASAAGCHAGP